MTNQKAASRLERVRQENGRLTGILNLPFKLRNQNFVVWTFLCDHGKPELQTGIQTNFEAIQKNINNTVDFICYQIKQKRMQKASSTPEQPSNSTIRLNADSMASVEKRISDSLAPLLQSIFVNLDKEELPRCLVMQSYRFKEKMSCGCGRNLDSLLLKKSNGKMSSIPIAKISKRYGVDSATIRNRAKDPNANFADVVYGLQQRHINSKSGSINSARVVSRLIRKMLEEAQGDAKEKSNSVFKKICETARLSPQHEFIFRSRFFTVPAMSFRDLADSPFLQCSHEWVRKQELEMLDQICAAYRLEPVVSQ